MISTDLATHDSLPERVFTGTDGYTGPVLADVTCPDGTTTVTVDPDATVATVRVFTKDGPDSTAAKAVRETRISQRGKDLKVVVPPTEPTVHNFGGGTVSFGNGGVRVMGGSFTSINTVNGRTFINGREVSGGSISTGVRVEVTLPVSSAVKYESENGSLHTYGQLAAIKGDSANGSIHAQDVGRIEASASNGSIKAGTVREWIDADASNGSVKVDDYQGNQARILAGNGSVKFTVAREASGRIDVRAGNGSVKLYGVRGRSDLDIRATAGNGTVKRF